MSDIGPSWSSCNSYQILEGYNCSQRICDCNISDILGLVRNDSFASHSKNSELTIGSSIIKESSFLYSQVVSQTNDNSTQSESIWTNSTLDDSVETVIYEGRAKVLSLIGFLCFIPGVF